MPADPRSPPDALLETLLARDGHALLEAVPGAGKTTRLLSLLPPLIHAGLCPVMVCFGHAHAENLRRRVPRGVKVQTLHALALSQLSERGHRVKPTPTARALHAELSALLHGDAPFEAQLEARRLSAHFEDLLRSRRDPRSLEGELDERTLTRLSQLYAARTNALPPTPTFSELLHHATRLQRSEPRRTCDVILLDEVQDNTPLALSFVHALLLPGVSLVAVGDPRQSIHRFAGAAPDAFGWFSTHLEGSVHTFPMARSWRVPERHAVLANWTFERHGVSRYAAMQPTEASGRVCILAPHAVPGALRPGDLVLCRTLRPLVTLALSLLENGTALRLSSTALKRSLEREVKALLERRGGKEVLSHAELRSRLDTRLDAPRRASPQAEEEGGVDEALLLEVLEVLCQGGGRELRRALEALFHPGEAAVLLSTVHAAKGAEAAAVFVLEPGVFPHPLAQDAEALQEEERLRFVALTRSRELLVLVASTHGEVADFLPPGFVPDEALERPPPPRRVRVEVPLEPSVKRTAPTPGVPAREAAIRAPRRDGVNPPLRAAGGLTPREVSAVSPVQREAARLTLERLWKEVQVLRREVADLERTLERRDHGDEVGEGEFSTGYYGARLRFKVGRLSVLHAQLEEVRGMLGEVSG